MEKTPVPRSLFIPVSVSAATLVLAVVIVVVSTSHTPVASGYVKPSSGPLVLTNITKNVKATLIDFKLNNGQANLRTGHSQIFDLADQQKLIGRNDFFCTETDPDVYGDGKAIALKCVYSYTLPGGTIEAGGQSIRPSLTSLPVKDTFAITGGTGIYNGASGFVTITAKSDGTSTFLLNIFHIS